MDNGNFETVIGLEIHVELKTNSKMFCGCSADFFGHEPNTHCCPVCLGLPGALPVPNKKAVEWCVMLGLALNCEIPLFSKFDRKNYFYPDLPKGYQISQYDKPFAINGWLDIKSEIRNPKSEINSKSKSQNTKRIGITRVHMEEDTGKLMHATVNNEKCTLVDFNRSGVPLIEIVTDPDIRSSEEAKIFLKKLYQIIRYLDISDADMEKGSMRLEPNISVINKELITRNTFPDYKVEVKNINSFNFVKKAVDFEIARQIELLKRGEIPVQETRGWDEKKGITYSQRSKEEAHDYRYFPEPDIPPIRWMEDQISKIKAQICELPDEKIIRFMQDYQLSEYDVTILTDEKETADYYEETLKHLKSGRMDSFQVEEFVKPKDTPGLARRDSSDGRGISITPKIIANWIINKKADITRVTSEELVELISQKTQKPTISNEELEKIIKKIIENNPKAITDYKSGKQQSLMFLLGQVMRETRGQADAETVKKIIIHLII